MFKRISNLSTVMFACSVLLLLNGCTSIFAAEGASTALSGKSVSDHVVSYMSGKNCSASRTENNLTYCVEDQPQHIEPTLYCYKTLANVSCYTSPDPGRSPDQIIQPGGYTSYQ